MYTRTLISFSLRQATIDNLQERLLREKSWLNADTSEGTALAAAMHIRKGNASKYMKIKGKDKNKKKRIGRKDVEYYYCQEKGNYARSLKRKK